MIDDDLRCLVLRIDDFMTDNDDDLNQWLFIMAIKIIDDDWWLTKIIDKDNVWGK